MRKIYSLLAVVIFMVIAGCNSGSDSTPTSSEPPPLSSEKAITQFSLDGVVGIIDETEKTIAVNLPNGSSLTALVATFTTSGAIVTVDSIVQVSGETDNDFTSLLDYTVTAADNSSQNYTVSVTTWGTATLIATDNVRGADEPQVAVDASGNAVAVWSQSDGTRHNIWSNRYTAGSGWGTATLIETDNAGGAGYPQVAVDAFGNAVAVWSQGEGTWSNTTNIWSNRYTVGSGWGTATLIETKSGLAYDPQVAVDASGNAVVVWRQYTYESRYCIWANRYIAGTGWGTARQIETGEWTVYEPQVAVDASGNAVAVWVQYDHNDKWNNIWSNRYTAGSGWRTATLIETNTGNAASPQVAVDASGNAVAVWSQRGGKGYPIWSNRYTAGAGWGTATIIATDNVGSADDPQVAMDASGNAVAVWSQFEGKQKDNIWSNRYTAGAGWGTATLIETDNVGTARYPQVAVDASGNAVVVWSQSDDTRSNIWSNRYYVGTGWGTATLIETDNAGGAGGPQVSIDASGNAVAVWTQYDGSRNSIWSNTYR